MASNYRKIRIFVASPGDVPLEREQLVRVVDELNQTLGAIVPEQNVLLELIRWETHVAPGLGHDAQDVVNRQLPEYEVFIGIMWKRMGSPTAVARSGTEEEFRRAYQKWSERKSMPVLFYFCQQPFQPPSTLDEVEQLRRVVEFRAELSNKGLVADYQNHDAFDDVVRQHLLMVLGRLLKEKDGLSNEPEAGTRLVGDAAAVRERLADLARQYDTLRATMASSDERTRAMGAVASRMRTLAIGGIPLLPELTASDSAGMRLAAITILEAAPFPAHIPWVAERFATEKPFLCYHAALALLSSVRVLESQHAPALRQAIDRGVAELERVLGKESARSTDRFQILAQARTELDAVAPPKPRPGRAKAQRRQ